MEYIDDLEQLVRLWEGEAGKHPAGDRYRSGLSVCAEQLRGTIERIKADSDG